MWWHGAMSCSEVHVNDIIVTGTQRTRADALAGGMWAELWKSPLRIAHMSWLPRPCRCSLAKSCPILCHPMDCSMPGLSLLRFMLTESVILLNHLILCLLLLLLPSIFPNNRVFSSKEFACQCRRRRRCRFHPWIRKILWRRKWQPLQYSCLKNPMDRGVWWVTVHGVSKSDKAEQLSRTARTCPEWGTRATQQEPGEHGPWCVEVLLASWISH